MAAFKVNITKNGNAIKFQFTDSDHYLYGNGEVEVPVNSLSLVIDESDFVTFKKASTNDTFITFNPANSNLSDKAGVIEFYKTNMVGSTGGGGSESGITSGEVQTMIDNSLEDYYTDDEVDAALSGKASASDVTAVASDVSTLSGQVATKVAITDFNAYSAATDARIAEDEEVTAAALNDLQENKADTSAVTAAIDAAISGKADTSAVTAAIDAAKAYYISFATLATVGIHDEDWDGIVAAIDDHRPIYAGYPRTDGGIIYYGVECMNKNSGNTQIVMTASDDNQHYFYTFVKNGSNDYSYTVDTRPYTTNQEKTAWNSKQDTLSAGTGIEISGNVISATGGGGATYSAGTNISIDTANTISCTLNLRNGTQTNSLTGVQGETKAPDSFAFGQNTTAGTNGIDNFAFAIGYGCKARKSRTFAFGATVDVKEIDSAAFGQYITLNAPRSFSTGYHNTTNNWANIALGEELTTNNRPEFATGAYNNSVTGSTASGQTLFSVGNGTSSARHNAFEVRQNGDIYVNDGTNDVRLQDTILALGGLKLVKLTQAEYDALATKDPDTLYIISNVVS